MKMNLKYLVTVCAVALASAAHAQTAPDRMTLEQVRALVRASLPPAIGKTNSELVKNLSLAKLDINSPLSKAFDPGKVTRAVFGRLSPNRDPGCSRSRTPTGDVDEGLCTSMFGEPGGAGEFRVLSYSKDMTVGDITFLKRPAQQELTPNTIKPVTIELGSAYDAAVKFGSDTLGLPRIEIATPPAGTDPAALVTTLALGFGQQDKSEGQIPLMRVVHVHRAAELPTALPDPASGLKLTHILAPGEATFFVDDVGVQGARVEGWVSLPIDPKLDPRLAKTDEQLADEIAQELFAGGGQKIAKVQMAFALAPSGYPNPDDPNPPLCPACGVLRPVLRVVMFTFDTQVESKEGEIAAPGLVHEFQLVDGTQEAPVRPMTQQQ